MLSKVYKILYTKTSKFILGHKVTAFTEVVIIGASGYLLVKKAFGLSISGWLLNNALHQSGVNVYVYTSGIILITAILLKVLSLIFVHFPAIKHATVAPEEISECLQVMNKEISNHIVKCDSKDTPNLRKIRDQHSFDVNTRLVAESLAEHIRKSISVINVKRKDVFISLYSYNNQSRSLTYELHYDPRRDLVQSKVIPLDEEKYAAYECVKCMRSSASTSYVLNRKKYARGNVKRHKTIEQYMGCKVETNGFTYGFLNIEFHNNSVFIDEEEMQDFMEENIFPFKLLLEYQYLKRAFFQRFEEYEKYWRVS